MAHPPTATFVYLVGIPASLFLKRSGYGAQKPLGVTADALATPLPAMAQVLKQSKQDHTYVHGEAVMRTCVGVNNPASRSAACYADRLPSIPMRGSVE